MTKCVVKEKRRISNNLCRYSTLKEKKITLKWQHTPVFLHRKSHGQSLSFEGYSAWGHRVGHELVTEHTQSNFPLKSTRLDSNLVWRKLTNNTSSRWERSTLTIRIYFDRIYTWYDVMRMGFLSVIFLPQTRNPRLLLLLLSRFSRVWLCATP